MYYFRPVHETESRAMKRYLYDTHIGFSRLYTLIAFIKYI